jgi:hypothetical protein
VTSWSNGPILLESLPYPYIKQLGDLTGKAPATIYTDLYTAFAVPRYQDLPEAEWDNVEKWFKTQIDRARARKKGKP